MASAEHCIYCFESLAAHLEGRSSLSLTEIEKLYPKYRDSNDVDLASGASEGLKKQKQIPALERLAEGSSDSSSSLPSSGSSMSLDPDTPGTSTSSLPTEREAIVESPLFVTWNTVDRSGNSNLRGCIGTFEAQELDEGLSSYAITSAVHDMRFNPISKRELPSLEVAVTLLTDFEECDDAMDWELGTHGIRLSFTDRGRRYGSTYLPDVAPEQGWDKEETIVSLLRKAGWVGKKNKWHELDLKVVRYQGKKELLQYAEFKQFRDWYNEHSKKA